MNTHDHLLRFAIDLDELAVRLLEARSERQRPLGMTAEEIMEALPENHRLWMMRQAQAAADYCIGECLHGQRLQ